MLGVAGQEFLRSEHIATLQLRQVFLEDAQNGGIRLARRAPELDRRKCLRAHLIVVPFSRRALPFRAIWLYHYFACCKQSFDFAAEVVELESLSPIEVTCFVAICLIHP